MNFITFLAIFPRQRAAVTAGLTNGQARTRSHLAAARFRHTKLLTCSLLRRLLRSIFSRTASRISRVGFTPRSAPSSAVSKSFRIEGSIFRSPRKIVSTVSENAALVLLTEFFSRSKRQLRFILAKERNHTVGRFDLCAIQNCSRSRSAEPDRADARNT